MVPAPEGLASELHSERRSHGVPTRDFVLAGFDTFFQFLIFFSMVV